MLHLPAPLPGQRAAEWQQVTNETRQVDLKVAEAWWQLHSNLVDSVQFVMPNKARSIKDETIRTWTRNAGHFVLRLKFRVGFLLTQQALQGKIREQLANLQKENREAGREAPNLFVDRTQTESERKHKGKGKGKEDGGQGKGQRPKGKGKGRKGPGR